MANRLRILIVGAGIAGSMAAWRLARQGHEVVVVEQFALDHDRGSSYGDSRIVRRVYADSLYTGLMEHSYRLWEELQSHFPNRELFHPTGGLFFGSRALPQIKAAQKALESSGVDYQVLDAGETMKRFPAMVLSSDELALWEPSMGYARASSCVRSSMEAATGFGAILMEERRVVLAESIDLGKRIRLTFESGDAITGDRAILAAGPWINNLLAANGVTLPLKVTRQCYVHLRPDSHPKRNNEKSRNDDPAPRDPMFEAGRFPVWIDAGVEAYGFPRLGDLPGVKLAMHYHGSTVDGETLRLEASQGTAINRKVAESDRDVMRAYARRRFRGLGNEIAYEKVCLYTNTPDNDFIVDEAPGLPGAYIISACSGHGFKFGPLIGEIAANLATEGDPRFDITRFRLNRFSATGLAAGS